MYVPDAHRDQKSIFNLLELELWMVCEPPCGCWKRNLGPLKEKHVLLTPEPSLQPWPGSLFILVSAHDMFDLSSGLYLSSVLLLAFSLVPALYQPGSCLSLSVPTTPTA